SNFKESAIFSTLPSSFLLEFKTKNGRSVYDGAGLDPDIEVPIQYYAPITVSLISKGLIFNYANLYASKRSTLASAKDFKMTDVEYLEFKNWLKGKEYDYTTKVEYELVKLEESAKKEKYFEDIESQLENLKNKVQHNRENDLIKFKGEIKQTLEEEIASRYFLEAGSIEASFKYDTDVKQSIQTLTEGNNYKKILGQK
ncbi:MAG: peptidase S41, partial [Bacteroidota bacterium]